MDKLFITLDGGRKLKIGTPQRPKQTEVKLRTVDKNQYQAKISVGVILNGHVYTIHRAFAENLQSSENGYSYLSCQIIPSGHSLTLTIRNRGRVVSRDTFSLTPKVLVVKRTLSILGGVLLLVGLVALIVWGIGSLGDTTSSIKDNSSQNRVEEKPREAPTPIVEPEVETPQIAERSNLDEVEKNRTEEISRTGESEVEAEKIDDEKPAEIEVVETPVPVVEEKVVLNLPYEQRVIYFTPNSTIITPKSEESLSKILVYLLEDPDINVRMIGHCAIAGTEAGRREISEQRAKNVEKWLRQKGWNPTMTPEVLGQASRFPVTTKRDEQDKNRRVELIVSY